MDGELRASPFSAKLDDDDSFEVAAPPRASVCRAIPCRDSIRFDDFRASSSTSLSGRGAGATCTLY